VLGAGWVLGKTTFCGQVQFGLSCSNAQLLAVVRVCEVVLASLPGSQQTGGAVVISLPWWSQ